VMFAAYMLAVQRVAEAMEVRGWIGTAQPKQKETRLSAR